MTPVHRLARELIAAVLRPGMGGRGLSRVARELEEALNAEVLPEMTGDETGPYPYVEIE